MFVRPREPLAPRSAGVGRLPQDHVRQDRVGLYTVAAIFLCAFSIRLALVFLTGQYRKTERYEMERAAIALAQRGVLADPYSLPTGPTAHVLPGYPAILAGIYYFFGTGTGAEIVKQALACTVTALTYALLPVVANSCGLIGGAGTLAGFAGALLPWRFETETLGDWEAPWTALILLLLAIRTVRIWTQDSPPGKPAALLFGAAWGLGALFSAQLAPVFFAVLAAGWSLKPPAGNKPYVRFSLAATVAFAVILSPWLIRNWVDFGRPVLRTNAGLELFLSNADGARTTQIANESRFLCCHPLQNPGEARLVQTLGEAEYNRRKWSAALAWIEAQPARFAALTLRRILAYWFQPGGASIKFYGLGLLTILGVLGMSACGARKPAVRFCLIAILVYPLMFYLVHVTPRYRYPLDWIFLLFSGHFVVLSLRRAQRPEAPAARSQ